MAANLPISKQMPIQQRLSGLSISAKGFCLAVILGIMELSFVAALGWQLHQADLRAVHQTEVKDIYLHSQDLVRSVYVGHELLCAYLLQRNQKAYDEYLQFADNIKNDIIYLDAHVAPTSANGMLYLQVASSARNWLSSGKITVEKIKRDPDSPTMVVPQEIVNSRNEIQNYLTPYWKAQQEALQPMTHNEDIFRQNMELLVWIGLAANVLFAFTLGAFFARDIASRLLQMVENTSRLRFSKELLPRLPGSDEIAQLDLAFHDMADRVRANERMKRAYIAMFRDELAKPLNEVRSSVAQISADLPPEGAKIVRTTDRNLSRLIGIIGDLTGIEDDTAAPLKLEIKTTSILEVVETSIDSVRSFASAHDVKIESKCEQHQIEADGDRLVQILVNFLSNASKFSPKHSVVTVSTEAKADKLRLNVTDRGRGIPIEKQKTVFEKFKQADAADGQRGVGTGLGLSICKQIAELHGGEVGVDSKEGEGSTFWIELPLKKEAARER